LEETVARRRAVTYPEAFSTAPPAAGAPLRTAAAVVRTSATGSRLAQSHPPPARARLRIPTTSHGPRRLPPPRAE
jgi:hypothetical protein